MIVLRSKQRELLHLKDNLIVTLKPKELKLRSRHLVIRIRFWWIKKNHVTSLWNLDNQNYQVDSILQQSKVTLMEEIQFFLRHQMERLISKSNINKNKTNPLIVRNLLLKELLKNKRNSVIHVRDKLKRKRAALFKQYCLNKDKNKPLTWTKI